MKVISIRELHDKTGEWIREAAEHGEILATNRGKTVAKILPDTGRKDTPVTTGIIIWNLESA
jgi:antitoxin (DNA-binding transcriptional repressor) of toxin-antitoxin stability system